MQDKQQEIEKELTNLNKELEKERNNLIYLLKNIDISEINLISFHFKIKELLNRINYLNKCLFDLKY